MKNPVESPGAWVSPSVNINLRILYGEIGRRMRVSEADFLSCKAFEGATKRENLNLAWVGICPDPRLRISEKENTCEVSATGRL